jgi:RHS repeat-associated protein
VKNQVKFNRNAWGQLTSDAQAHSGSVTTSTPAVRYEYAPATHNHVRHTATVYPSGRRLLTQYEGTASLDHRLSRPTRLTAEGEAFPSVSYLYAGLSWIVRTHYPQPNVELRHYVLPSEANGDAGDPYRAFDRFGRLEEVRWRHGGTGAWIEHLFYGYDKASLRRWKDVDAAGIAEDELFDYDGLYQVTQRQRGVLNTARTAITGTPERQEDFEFDPLGNWEAYTLRANGTVQNDQSNTRTHNEANQITGVTPNSGTAAAIAHDHAGNMTKTAPDKDGDWTKGYKLKWDAWNRLVAVRRQEDDTLVATYHYDGLFRRTHSTVDGTDRHFLYDRAWRVLEERPGSETATPDRLYTWGVRHRTDMVCRDAELPGIGSAGSDSGDSGGSSSTSIRRHYVAYDWISPTAILDLTSGDPLERYSYSAFGQRKVMDAGYSERAGSEYAWSSAFHGQFEDAETEWMNYGFRYYLAHDGRWLSRDILGESAGVNLYAAYQNSGINYTDIYGLATISIRAHRQFAGRMATYGTLTITTDDANANKCCGLPKSYKTIEPPYGRQKHKLHETDFTTPEWSLDEPAGRDSVPTSPSGMNNFTPPPKPDDVNQIDFDSSHTMELHVHGRINVHYGESGLWTNGCILLGTAYVETKIHINNTEHVLLQPGTKLNEEYLVPGFDLGDSRNSHIRFNASIACVERVTGTKAKFRFHRRDETTGNASLPPAMPIPPVDLKPPRAIPINDELMFPSTEENLGIPAQAPTPSGNRLGLWRIFRR